MRRGLIILALGLAGAVIAYCCVYLSGTTAPRRWMQSDQPELTWLKHEFNLSDGEFARVSELHAAYLPQCQEMCRRIAAQNDSLEKLLANASSMTPEIEGAIAEAARLRGQCQRNMLQHFFEVSRTMPAEQGRRYLEWLTQMTWTSAMSQMEHDAHP